MVKSASETIELWTNRLGIIVTDPSIMIATAENMYPQDHRRGALTVVFLICMREAFHTDSVKDPEAWWPSLTMGQILNEMIHRDEVILDLKEEYTARLIATLSSHSNHLDHITLMISSNIDIVVAKAMEFIAHHEYSKHYTGYASIDAALRSRLH